MQEFIILHYGFVRPTPEIMTAWNVWFDSIKSHQIERGHFPVGYDFSEDETSELPLSRSSITGYTKIRADSFEAAKQIAASCPKVDSTRVYAIQG